MRTRLYNSNLEYTRFTLDTVLPYVEKLVIKLYKKFPKAHPHDLTRLLENQMDYHSLFASKK